MFGLPLPSLIAGVLPSLQSGHSSGSKLITSVVNTALNGTPKSTVPLLLSTIEATPTTLPP